MKLGQQMRLARRMIQSMEILQMPLHELEERIEQELENNVSLEVAGPEEGAEPAPAAPEAETREQENADSFEHLDDFESSNPDAAGNEYSASGMERQPDYRPASRGGDSDAKFEAMNAAPARGISLSEELTSQWRLANVDPALRDLGELIIQHLDEDGYLRTPLETVAQRAPADENGNVRMISPDDLEFALEALQGVLDPPGIAARDLRECLLLQLDALLVGSDDPDEKEGLEIARWLVEDHLDDITQNRLPKIADATGLTLDEVRAGMRRLQRLSVAPARTLSGETARPIIPDAIVEYDEDQDRYIAYMNDRITPNLRINQEYAKMSRDRALAQNDRSFIRTNLSNAQWLIDAIEQRRNTLIRVIQVVLELQRDFFDYGPQSLKPLPMAVVADRLGVHVATVSRAVADKYIQTPRGVVPLRRFFTGGLATEDGGEVSYDAVRSALRDVIEGEDKERPLSDDAIVKALADRGIEIARRTVAKYRDQLGIPTARLRKQFA